VGWRVKHKNKSFIIICDSILWFVYQLQGATFSPAEELAWLGIDNKFALDGFFWMEFLICVKATIRNPLLKLPKDVQGIVGYQTSLWIPKKGCYLQILSSYKTR
jgi:hypothetical protein